ISFNPWYFSLLARIVSDDDPMTVPEGTFTMDNVKNNNNIALKNASIITVYQKSLDQGIGAVIKIGNASNNLMSYSLELFNSDKNSESNIYEDAEIGIKIDSILFNAWKKGNKNGYNLIEINNEKKVIITGDNAVLDDIQLEPGEYGTAYITFNFL